MAAGSPPVPKTAPSLNISNHTPTKGKITTAPTTGGGRRGSLHGIFVYRLQSNGNAFHSNPLCLAKYDRDSSSGKTASSSATTTKNEPPVSPNKRYSRGLKIKSAVPAAEPDSNTTGSSGSSDIVSMAESLISSAPPQRSKSEMKELSGFQIQTSSKDQQQQYQFVYGVETGTMTGPICKSSEELYVDCNL
jgi:hypothetical protein